MTAQFTISAFGDEIAPDLESQLKTLKDLNVNYLELRGVDGKNVLKFDEADIAHVNKTGAEYGVKISCIGSPLGKSPIQDPIQNELNNLSRIMEIGDAVGTKRIRIFSFYPPDTSTNENYDRYVADSIDRLKKMAELAATKDFMLLLENEKGIVGDTPERCQEIMEGVNHPNMKFIWDPANFVQVGAAKLTETAWSTLGHQIGYIHIKDAVLSDGSVRAAGEGDGQVPELLQKLIETGYQGYLAMEPHLAVAGHSSGFSGVEGMTYAVNAIRKIMTDVGAVETAEGPA